LAGVLSQEEICEGELLHETYSLRFIGGSGDFKRESFLADGETGGFIVGKKSVR